LKLSIIVTTKSNEDNLYRLLRSVKDSTEKFHEFIIVDAGTPNAKSICSLFPFTTYIEGKGTNRSEGKNKGISESTGDIVAFLDDDTEIPDDSWFDEVMYSITFSGIVAGYSPNPGNDGLPRVSINIEGQDITLPTCNIAYQKDVFDSVGLFDEKLITGEDIDLNYRSIEAGYAIFYNPRMKLYHYHRTTFKGFAKQAFWNGYGRKQLNDKYPDLRKKHQHGIRIKGLVRLGFGAIGFIFGRFLCK